MGALLPMNIFLRQEIDRIKKVIGIVQKTLCDLKLAIDGTIVMSQGLRESLDAMYDARIPQKWQKVIQVYMHYSGIFTGGFMGSGPPHWPHKYLTKHLIYILIYTITEPSSLKCIIKISWTPCMKNA